MGIYANVAVIANFHLFTGHLPLVIIPQELMKLRGGRNKKRRGGKNRRKRREKKKKMFYSRVP